MGPRFREGEVVRLLRSPGGLDSGAEAVVEEVAGPNDGGTGWLLTLRLCGETEADSMIVLDEDDVRSAGVVEGPGGERVPIASAPPPEEPADCLELRLFTEITDVSEAAAVAQSVEQEIAALLGGATVTTEAERHWSKPYNYELSIVVVPDADPVEALQIIAEAGGDGWLACRDDGWRCELWWSASRDPDSMLIVPEVHAAEVAFVPWSSPARRDEGERPLVAVSVPEEPPDEPPAPGRDSDAEAGDEEP